MGAAVSFSAAAPPPEYGVRLSVTVNGQDASHVVWLPIREGSSLTGVIDEAKRWLVDSIANDAYPASGFSDDY